MDQLDDHLHAGLIPGIGIDCHPHLALHRLPEQSRQCHQSPVEPAHVVRQQANACAAADHLQHQFVGMQLHHPRQSLIHHAVPWPKMLDLTIMLPLHQHEIGQVIQAVRPSRNPRVALGNVWQVIEPRQPLGFAGDKTRTWQRRIGAGQPHHYVGTDGLQGQFAVQGNDVQTYAGVAAQQRDQVAAENVVQDGFGHCQAYHGLFDHRQLAFVGQGHQLRLQLLPITA
ncbi:hypothetical protein D3C87_1499020 [compost metagenome]